MSGAVCPACGVAVMPGYVRCPKCRKPLPRLKTAAVVRGGTAVEETPRRWPLFAVLGVAILAGVAFMVLGRGSSQRATTPAPGAAPAVSAPTPAAPTEAASAPPVDETRPAQPATPDPNALAAGLERDLKRQRLWSTVTVTGARVDVRSGSCSEPAMAPMLDGAAASFKAAGLTKLRCVEQSGRVVSDRDL